MSLRRRRQRLPYRVHLAVAFSATAFGAGLFVLALLYVFLRLVPTYLITPAGQPDELGAPEIGDTGVPPTDGAPPSAGATDGVLITDAASLLDTVLWAGAGILVLLSALAASFGWVIAGRMLAPLSRVRDAARKAGAGSLGHRISLTGPRDEIRDLADTFDHTLDRLEQAFRAHERFTANVAHELRTPLSTAKTLLDVASAHPGATETSQLVAQLRANNDRSIALVQAFLTLTELERPLSVTDEMDLAPIVLDAARALPAQTGSAVGLQLEPARVHGDAVLTSLLIENLLQNAQRHNDARGVIAVTTLETGSVSVLRVENTCAPLAPEELARLTEPLYRPERSARRGHGLGLAIVESVARAHRATLELAARDGGGIVATVRFRRASWNGGTGRDERGEDVERRLDVRDGGRSPTHDLAHHRGSDPGTSIGDVRRHR
jgi:two-component system, OmpR family, sensor histidine kinase VanS